MSRLLLIGLGLVLLLALPAAAPAEPLDLELTLNPTLASPGQEVMILVNLLNPGREATEPDLLTILAGGQTIAQTKVPGLKPGASYAQRLLWTAQGQGKVIIEARLAKGKPVRAEVKVEGSGGGPGGEMPDLALSWLSAPPQGCLDQGSWQARIGVVNKGRGASSPGRLLFAVNGRAVDQAVLPGLNPGQELVISFSWTEVRSGANTLTAALDQEVAARDADPNNNQLSQDFILRICRPDLAVVGLRLDGPVEPGRRPMKAEAVVANVGGKEIDQFSVRFLVDGRVVKTVTMGRLGPGQRRPVKAEWMPPGPGTYRLAAEALPLGGEMEIDSANNARELTFTTKDDLPDLQMDRPEMESNICLGPDPVIIEVRVFNRGMKSSPKASVSLRSGTQTLARAELPGLTPGQSHLLRLSWRPGGTGVYHLHLVADPNKELKESNESNNVASFQVRLRDCRADLALTAINLPERLGAEESGRRVAIPVYNRGLKASQPTTLTLKLNGRVVETRKLGRVEPGAKVLVEFPLEKLEPGRVVLEVEIDPSALGDEISRDNNHLKRIIQVRSEEVDLSLEKVWTEPDQPRAGQPYRVRVLAANQGAGVGEVEIAVTIDGREAGRTKIPGMWPRASKEAGLTVEGSPAGVRVIRVVMDPEGRLTELNKANNVRELKVTVVP